MNPDYQEPPQVEYEYSPDEKWRVEIEIDWENKSYQIIWDLIIDEEENCASDL